VPTYVYRCDQCGGEIEKRQRFSDEPLSVCESCGGALRRVLQPVGVIFRGSGFYSTDYRNGSATTQAESKTDSAPEASGSDGQKAAEPSSSSATTAPSSSGSAPPAATSASKTD